MKDEEFFLRRLARVKEGGKTSRTVLNIRGLTRSCSFRHMGPNDASESEKVVLGRDRRRHMALATKPATRAIPKKNKTGMP